MIIEKNIKLPKKLSGRPLGSSKYAALVDGDTIPFDCIKKARSANGGILQYFERNNKQLTTSVRKEGEGGRIWIIEKPKN